MSGPGGHSGITNNPNFANLAHKALGKKKSEGSSTFLPEDDDKPSKGLPHTGLKKNTQEYQDQQAERAKKGKGKGKGLERRESYSSSSSIPSNATGSDDDEDEEERIAGQEGALGRGKGRHEREIHEDGRQGYENGGDMVESPTEEEHQPNGSSTPDGKSQAPKANGYASKHERRLENGDREEDEHHNDGEDGFDPEERMIRRNSRRNNKLRDESGHFPDGLPGVKPEEPPGPRNEIVLDPRISHMHVSGATASTEVLLS
jgi:hypothetical protein